jgi:hypothetical protein
MDGSYDVTEILSQHLYGSQRKYMKHILQDSLFPS